MIRKGKVLTYWVQTMNFLSHNYETEGLTYWVNIIFYLFHTFAFKI